VSSCRDHRSFAHVKTLCQCHDISQLACHKLINSNPIHHCNCNCSDGSDIRAINASEPSLVICTCQHIVPMLYNIHVTGLSNASFRCYTQLCTRRWSGLLHTCDMTHSYAQHDSFICVNMNQHIVPLLYNCTHVVGANSFMYATRLIGKYIYESTFCDSVLHISHSSVRYDSFMCIHMGQHIAPMSHPSFISTTSLIRKHNITHSCV